MRTYKMRTLWFDVGIKRYTTKLPRKQTRDRCGLM